MYYDIKREQNILNLRNTWLCRNIGDWPISKTIYKYNCFI